MRSHRSWPLLGIIVTLIAGAGCAHDLGPSEVPAELSITGTTDTRALGLLACSPQRYQVTTRVVGPKGGRIKAGSHVLNIPAGALSQDVEIVVEQLTGSTNQVRVSPDGLGFDVPAELTMNYSNCLVMPQQKSVARTDETLKILEVLQSDDQPQTKTVTSPIGDFSRYAVAY
jgi:hypothetical protein